MTVPAYQMIDAVRLASLLDYPSLVARIDRAFIDPIRCPARLVIPRGLATMLVMAAARDGGFALTKVVTVGPAAVRSEVMLTGESGQLVALIDGETLTARRTAAASVRAAAMLARADAATLAVLGAGPQAAALARAYAACRPLDRVLVWSRRIEAAQAFADALIADTALPVAVARSAAAAVREADIVTVATRATEPLVLASDVRAGAHVDLVGGFRPAMREADDALIARARVVADCAQALVEAGDLAAPIAAGVKRAGDVALLGQLLGATAPVPARQSGEITVYKSVGFAALDLVAAELALERLEGDHG